MISGESVVATPPARNAPARFLGLFLLLDPVVERRIIDHFVAANIEQNWFGWNWAQFRWKVNFAVLFAKVSNFTLKKGTLDGVFRFELTKIVEPRTSKENVPIVRFRQQDSRLNACTS